jgi:ribosomal protein L44E
MGAGFESLGIRPAAPTNTAVVECTIPPDMTIERWRRFRRSTAPTQRDPWSRLLAAARRVARHGERRCDHLHDTVNRYDHAAKRLELLLTCPVCETEKLIHSLAYEPRFEPSVASVHALHPREGAAVDAQPRSVGGTAGLRGCAVIERRDGTANCRSQQPRFLSRGPLTGL